MVKPQNIFSLTPGIRTSIYLFVVFMFLFSLISNLYNLQMGHRKFFEFIAETSVMKDKMYREWVTSHGGVYVPVTKETPPNPYLKVPQRDVNISGRPYTLVNPAYMTRQVMEKFSFSHGLKGHITSLKPINPYNAPDEWEIRALKSFEQGEKRKAEFVMQGDEEYLRYMIPFMTEEKCLKCHADQGYKLGDVRGGISILLALSAYKVHNDPDIILIVSSHAILLFFALFVIRYLIRKAEDEYNRRIAQENLLLQQTKNAQMGEMLSMIAHQWRQPLNAISASAIVVRMRGELGELDSTMIEKQMGFIQEQTQNMSKIINDFMNYFRPEKEKVLIQSDNIMEALNTLISPQLANRGIQLVCNVNSSFKFYTYPRELEHILLNLIFNARDAYENITADDKIITLGCKHTDGRLEISVCDHAGGIPENYIGKIFDPYFTTKEQGKGTGIGLYMVRRIVQEIFEGTISVVNRDGGACFILSIPMDETLTQKEKD